MDQELFMALRYIRETCFRRASVVGRRGVTTVVA